MSPQALRCSGTVVGVKNSGRSGGGASSGNRQKSLTKWRSCAADAARQQAADARVNGLATLAEALDGEERQEVAQVYKRLLRCTKKLETVRYESG